MFSLAEAEERIGAARREHKGKAEEAASAAGGAASTHCAGCHPR